MLLRKGCPASLYCWRLGSKSKWHDKKKKNRRCDTEFSTQVAGYVTSHKPKFSFSSTIFKLVPPIHKIKNTEESKRNKLGGKIVTQFTLTWFIVFLEFPKTMHCSPDTWNQYVLNTGTQLNLVSVRPMKGWFDRCTSICMMHKRAE